MRLIFLGTPEFAVPTLECAAAAHDVVAVYTQPDRPKGRGNALAKPPVKESAERLGIPVRQPERIKRPEVVEELRAWAPEAIIVVGYGQILSKTILDIPPKGTINVHASLLPAYRGAAPIQWAIARGETRTGVTTMLLNEGLDTGDMLLRWETEIGPEENAVDLSLRMASAGADLLVQTLARLDTIRPEPQDDVKASYAPILKKEDGRIDWTLRAEEIVNRVRGFQPWPGAYSSLGTERGTERLQIWKAAKGPAPQNVAPGTMQKKDSQLIVACGDGGSIVLQEIQWSGKKRMTAAAFLNGWNQQEALLQ